MAGYLGIDLTQAPEEPMNLVGRPGTIACRYATVELVITDVRETYRWSAHALSRLHRSASFSGSGSFGSKLE
jgi:hypothetical protein